MIKCKDCEKEEATDTGRCERCESTWQAMYEFGNRPENLPKKREKIRLDDGPLRCKVCGKEFMIGGMSPMLTITPNCKCKSMRSREREKGCLNCGSSKIGLTFAFGEYTAKCHTCGREWWVMEDVI